jgi:hypothetical protein
MTLPLGRLLIFLGPKHPKSTGSVEICQRLLQTPLGVSTMRYLVSYDLMSPGKNYEPLWAALRELGAVRVLDSEWAVTLYNTTPLKVANYVAQFMDANDRLLVTEMPDNYAFMNLIAKPKAA